MRFTTSITTGLLLAALTAQDAAAQWNVARFDADRNRVYTTFGLDPAFVSGMGYGRVVPVMGHDVQFSGEGAVAAARLDVRDFRVRLGMQTSLVRVGALRVTASAVGIARGTENTIYRGYNFGSDVTGTAGLYRRGWFAAGEFGFDKNIITHVEHSDWYRRNYYPDAKDGWYQTAGGTFHYGVTGGIALGGTEVAMRVGYRRTERFKELTPPVYATVGVGYAF